MLQVLESVPYLNGVSSACNDVTHLVLGHDLLCLCNPPSQKLIVVDQFEAK